MAVNPLPGARTLCVEISRRAGRVAVSEFERVERALEVALNAHNTRLQANSETPPNSEIPVSELTAELRNARAGGQLDENRVIWPLTRVGDRRAADHQ